MDVPNVDIDSEPPAQKAEPTFMGLPTEIRLAIYDECVTFTRGEYLQGPRIRLLLQDYAAISYRRNGDTSTFAALSKTCRTTHGEVQEYLYANITFEIMLQDPKVLGQRHLFLTSTKPLTILPIPPLHALRLEINFTYTANSVDVTDQDVKTQLSCAKTIIEELRPTTKLRAYAVLPTITHDSESRKDFLMSRWMALFDARDKGRLIGTFKEPCSVEDALGLIALLDGSE